MENAITKDKSVCKYMYAEQSESFFIEETNSQSGRISLPQRCDEILLDFGENSIEKIDAALNTLENDARVSENGEIKDIFLWAQNHLERSMGNDNDDCSFVPQKLQETCERGDLCQGKMNQPAYSIGAPNVKNCKDFHLRKLFCCNNPEDSDTSDEDQNDFDYCNDWFNLRLRLKNNMESEFLD